ncbi:MAG TPA: tryptophan 7-halogenase [Tepidisphaeraceae bacterium]|jgi:tryptophan halogenase|nr:tryptophan 7-halogenase [Tepidisphaeraceae bacterium]
MIREILVLGAGSAGFLAAITLKRKIPGLSVRVVRSPEIGVIGVGESTTPAFPEHLFEYLGINRRQFYAQAEPTWKMGIHFIWGPRGAFEYGFEPQLDVQWGDLARPNGYYCEEDFTYVNLQGSLMAEGKAFARNPNGGGPEIPPWHALHIENIKLVAFLEKVAREIGVEIVDGKMKEARRGPEGIEAIVLEDGRKFEADFFVDASGFRSELLGGAMKEPYISFAASLFSDRAIVGNWDRTDEPILPYTTAETMDAGWCWRIDHEQSINRGYVYSSAAMSDDEAREEFLRKNPKAKTWDHVVKFKTGRYARGWVDNVMGIGNASGFVEPLESTSLMVICWQSKILVDFLLHTGLAPTPTIKKLFNDVWAATWDEIRDFLTLHYWANTKLDTSFWKHCRGDTDISRLAPLLEFYDENGPTGFCRYHLGTTGSQFGIEGFLVMLVGNRVPYRGRYAPTEAEWKIWNQRRAQFKAKAQQGLDVKEALACIKHPGWRWAMES